MSSYSMRMRFDQPPRPQEPEPSTEDGEEDKDEEDVSSGSWFTDSDAPDPLSDAWFTTAPEKPRSPATILEKLRERI